MRSDAGRVASRAGRFLGASISVAAMVVVAACGADGAGDQPAAAGGGGGDVAVVSDELPPASDPSGHAAVAAAPGSAPIFGGQEGLPLSAWDTVNDPVMGGLSASGVQMDGDSMVFAGTVSLDNGGGFASTRSPVDPVIGERAAGAGGLAVRARGDGSTYVLQVRATGEPHAHIARFTTTADTDELHRIPLDRLEAVDFFLEPLAEPAGPLDPAAIEQIALYILDEQAGPFELVVHGIDALPAEEGS